MYIIEALKAHDRNPFDCGEEALNRYLRERAMQDIKRKLNRVFIIRENARDRILGYYTLAAVTIEAAKLPPAQAKYLPRYPIPAALLGKLAVDQNCQGKGLGKLLLANAIRRIEALEKDIGIHVLVVDPLNETASKFYTALNFKHFPSEKRLFLFLDGLEKP